LINEKTGQLTALYLSQQSNGNRPVIFLKTSLKDLPGRQGSHPAVEELAADDFE